MPSPPIIEELSLGRKAPPQDIAFPLTAHRHSKRPSANNATIRCA